MLNRMNARSRLVWSPPLLLAACAVAGASVPTQLVARTGDTVPQLPENETILFVDEPGVSTSDAFALAVTTRVDGGASPEFFQVLLRRLPGTGVFEEVARTGSEGPRPGVQYALLDVEKNPNDERAVFAHINASGDMAFLATMLDETPNELTDRTFVNAAFRVPADGAVQEAWQWARPIEGLDRIEFVNGTNTIRIDDEGVFRSPIFYNNNDRALLTLDDDATSLGPDTLFDGDTEYREFDLAINDAGNSLAFNFRSSGRFLATDTLSISPRFIISRGHIELNGDFERVLGLVGPSIAEDGAVAFSALLRDPLAYRLCSVGVDAEPIVLAVEGELAPGTDGATFDLFRETFAASADEVFFTSTLLDLAGEPLPDEENTGIWLARSYGSPVPIVRRGAVAPGTDAEVFGTIPGDDNECPIPFAINARADAVFFAGLGPNPGRCFPQDGMWAYDNGTGEVRLVVRLGDVVDVSRPGGAPDVRTVAFIKFNPDTGLAANGRIGYSLVFTDGTEAAFTTFVGENAWACTADFNADGVIDMGDFGTFASAFDSAPGDASYDARADLSGDHDVDLGDFGLFAQRFGRDDCPQ